MSDRCRKIKLFLTKEEKIGEALIMSCFLALSGGFQDAYTYINRGKVYANAQTGNIVMMSMNFMQGNLGTALRYMMPLLAFIGGVLVADLLRFHVSSQKKLHWRQLVLLIEVIIMAVSGFFGQEWNMAANILISFSCALQVQSFRKVGGHVYASTMCIGNLRSGTQAFADYLLKKEKEDLKKMFYYMTIIFFFAMGAGIGGNLSIHFHEKTIWVTEIFLLICFFLLELDRRDEEEGKNN